MSKLHSAADDDGEMMTKMMINGWMFNVDNHGSILMMVTTNYDKLSPCW